MTGLAREEAASFFPALLLAAALDALPLPDPLRCALGMILCLAAFCRYPDGGPRMLSRVAFLLFSAADPAGWTLTVLWMALFEHIPLIMLWKEASRHECDEGEGAV